MLPNELLVISRKLLALKEPSLLGSVKFLMSQHPKYRMEGVVNIETDTVLRGDGSAAGLQ